ncbi:hypothetical protein GCM10010495_78630 [Kitasatospora herbaricolor]|uniref:DUF6325 family protein n=1 Tax=Kitasatospora herbaricolor TaxID=68217 RepID=UPI0017491780|nr:DUF6325 family protein [Kitasatospora herbaricolor]MDQ0312159.1 hypothetical protein [Kitasatospora herbaricolor]GGV49147.1 hypothetical protein GCM10010495_78630 [Kitasatospora herbaricolor]
MSNESSEPIEPGPIDYLIVEFPGSRLTGEGMPLLADLVDRGIIRILDLTFVRKEEDGSVSGIELADVNGDGQLDLAVFEGVSSGLLGEEERSQAGAILSPGDSAAVLLYENLWAAPLAAALRRAGARMIARGHVPVEDLIEALDALDAKA